MEKIYNNLAKIVCIVMVAALIISAFVLFTANADEKTSFERKSKELTGFQLNGGNNHIKNPDYLSEVQEQSRVDLRQAKRNIFASYQMDDKEQQQRRTAKPETPVLELLDISYKPLGFQYQGRIVYPDGQVVAQVNSPYKSYLVETGSKIDSFVVASLDKNIISLKGDGGKQIKIKYLQTAYSEELMAKIRENVSGIINIVHPKSSLFGYQVLDIEQDAVILSKYGQRLRLQKGMVQK
jgi:hypothetical protein